MGDTIHAVKPYYGLGCVSALQVRMGVCALVYCVPLYAADAPGDSTTLNLIPIAHQDATTLDRCLDETNDDLSKALPLYSKKRGPEAKALVEFQVRFAGKGCMMGPQSRGVWSAHFRVTINHHHPA